MNVSAPLVPRATTIMLIAAFSVLSGSALAATGATKDEAIAMVKKAVSAIKTEGADKAYPQISSPSRAFVDRDLYIVVYGLDGMVLAHGADAKRVGTNQIADKDPDGKAFVKERVERAATDSSFWQTYKFMNPVTQKIEPKEMYCERLDQIVVCGGVYKF